MRNVLTVSSRIITLIVLLGCSSLVHSQSQESDAPAQNMGTQKPADLLKVVDQLVEQNAKLEKQNQELMETIKALRSAVDHSAAANDQTVDWAPTRPSTQSGQAAQSVNQNQSTSDDKTLLPEPSEGNAVIFGEFNPGRGFTVGRGEHGELNLSGYMVARYLNQLPPDQSATDHLGRSIKIAPRQDFQFHRVMLFSQGWLFSPKFQ